MDKIKKKNKCDADFRLVIVTGLLDRDQLHNVMLLLLLLSIDSETNFRKINFSLFLYPIVSCANITLGGDFSVRDRAEEEEKRPHSPPPTTIDRTLNLLLQFDMLFMGIIHCSSLLECFLFLCKNGWDFYPVPLIIPDRLNKID